MHRFSSEMNGAMADLYDWRPQITIRIDKIIRFNNRIGATEQRILVPLWPENCFGLRNCKFTKRALKLFHKLCLKVFF